MGVSPASHRRRRRTPDIPRYRLPTARKPSNHFHHRLNATATVRMPARRPAARVTSEPRRKPPTNRSKPRHRNEMRRGTDGESNEVCVELINVSEASAAMPRPDRDTRSLLVGFPDVIQLFAILLSSSVGAGTSLHPCGTKRQSRQKHRSKQDQSYRRNQAADYPGKIRRRGNVGTHADEYRGESPRCPESTRRCSKNCAAFKSPVWCRPVKLRIMAGINTGNGPATEPDTKGSSLPSG